MWTISEAKLFRRCQKQWYFKHRFASALAKKEPAKREAFILGSLQTIEQWRGQVVDKVVETFLVPALNDRREILSSELKREADIIFDRQLAFAKAHRVREPNMTKSSAGKDFAALLKVEESGNVSDEQVAIAREEMNRALDNLVRIPGLREDLRSARRVVAQHAFHFKLGDVSIKAVPDLVAFYGDRPPLIIDWKVHFFGLHDARTQLLIYAMALARSGKAGGAEQLWKETDISTAEAQLLTGTVRRFKLDENAAIEMEDYILSSVRAIDRATGGMEREDIDPDDLAAVTSIDGCANCGFKSICWRTKHENN